MKRTSLLLASILTLIAVTSWPTIRVAAQSSGAPGWSSSAAVTDDNLKEMIESAKTPADHEAIAAYYDQQAAEANKKAALHRNSADTYRKLKISKPVGMAEMCDGVAAMWSSIAADDTKLANAQRELAKQ